MAAMIVMMRRRRRTTILIIMIMISKIIVTMIMMMMKIIILMIQYKDDDDDADHDDNTRTTTTIVIITIITNSNGDSSRRIINGKVQNVHLLSGLATSEISQTTKKITRPPFFSYLNSFFLLSLLCSSIEWQHRFSRLSIITKQKTRFDSGSPALEADAVPLDH